MSLSSRHSELEVEAKQVGLRASVYVELMSLIMSALQEAGGWVGGWGRVGRWGGPARDLLPNTSVPFS